MSEFMVRFRKRVEEEIAPVRRLAGEDAQPVRTALRVLQIAEETEEELAQEWATTATAVEVTGWSLDTLQAHAKTAVEDGALPDRWAGIEVRKGADGYLIRIGSIPQKNASAA